MARTNAKTAAPAAKALNGRKQTTTAARKAAPTKAKEATVPGHPNIKMVTGKGVTERTIAAIQSANRGQDSVAILNDGSTHVCTKHFGAGVVVKAGTKWDNVNSEFLAMQRKEAEIAKAKPKGAGTLATGVDSRNAPHSAKAIADNRKGAAEPKPAKADKAAKKTAAKAKRAEKAAPKADDTRTIKVLNKKFTYGGEGTARRASWDAAAKGGKVADYLKAGGKAKYLPRFVSAGAISLVG